MSEVLFTDAGAGLGVHGSIVVAAVEGRHAFCASTARRVLDATHVRHLTYVYIVAEEANLPDEETRRVVASIAEHVDAIVGVHEGSGFRASAIRGLITSINLLSRRPVRPEIFATLEDAAAHLHRRIPRAGAADDIVSAIAAIRAAVRDGE